MDQEVKIKWIKALRSGKYKQITNKLCDGEGFCCLGVLCEISNLPKHVGSNKVFYTVETLDREPYQIWGDFPYHGALGVTGEQATELTSKNDGRSERRHSFGEIADWIEQNL